MARRKLLNKLVHINNINEELRLIEDSLTDYVTASGKIFKDYGKGWYLPKTIKPNPINGYIYVGVTLANGKNRSTRLHRLVAKAFIPNPNNLQVVGHKDNIKTNNNVENLYWTTIKENTQKAYSDGLIENRKSWEDSQSVPVCVFDLNKNLIDTCGSVGECSLRYGVTKTAVLSQCKHKMHTRPRKGYYFRYLSEYNECGFVL